MGLFRSIVTKVEALSIMVLRIRGRAVLGRAPFRFVSPIRVA